MKKTKPITCKLHRLEIKIINAKLQALQELQEHVQTGQIFDKQINYQD